LDLTQLVELFGCALLALGATALSAPLIGAFLYARGTALQGLVLPQLATFGVALGYALSPLFARAPEAGHGHGGHAGHDHAVAAADVTHLAWASAGVLVGLGALTWLARRRGSETARLAGAFAVASGGTVVCAELSPFGGLHLDALTSGEALAVGPADAGLVLALASVTIGLVAWAWRDATLVMHDRPFARALGVPVARIDAAAALCTAALVVGGTLALGPLPLFALLVLPPLGVRRGAPSMAGFLVRSALAGFVGATVGAALSFGADLPLGASVVAGTALVALIAALALGPAARVVRA
jgi:ABC-type Mn2+/Zn2+ transport system permease subunit